MEDRRDRRKSLYGFEVREPDIRRSPTKVTEIKSLWNRHHEIIGMSLAGADNASIAAELDLHPQTVSNTLNSEIAESKMSSMREKRDEEYIDVAKRIVELQEKAIKVYDEIFDSDTVSYSLKKKAADTIMMDIGGYRAPTKIESKSSSVTATLEEIEAFKQAGYLAAKEAGYIVDIPEGDNHVSVEKT